MRLVKLALSICAASFLVNACTQPTTVTTNQTAPTVAASPAAKTIAPTDELAAARANFQKNCMGCHVEDGTGGVKTVDGKKLRVPNLREGHALKDPDEDFVKQIMNGGDGMPAFKDKMSPEQINELVRFIRKEFQGK